MIPPDSTPTPDWESFLRQHEKDSLTELELETLRPGDHVLVLTQQTAYRLVLRSGAEAELTTNRSDRPSGIVTINGCTFGASSSIKPGHLFCGGNLEFRPNDTRTVYTTTEIRAIQVIQRTSEQLA
jgi:hypothetical protein